MLKTAKELLEKIDADKELLLARPKNNLKNKAIYYETVENMKKEYSEYEEKITIELKKRYEKEVNVEPDSEIEILKGRIETRDKIIYLLNNYKTSYEKMGLDKVIYKLEKFYKENLENVNEQIKIAIQKFSDVGINLTILDFNYSPYVREYMESFFKEMVKDDVNSATMKNKFEEIYWKCPEIIIHIELNFRNIYMRNEAAIDKYFLKEKNDLLKTWEKTPEEIIRFYLELKTKKIEKEQNDKSILLKKFMEGEFQTKDYLPEKLSNAYNSLISENLDKSIEEKEAEINITKFLNSLYEYKNYMEFEFIINDIRKCYKEKDNYKKEYEQIRKTIYTNEAKLKKINKKMTKKSIFTNGKESFKAEQNELILQLKDNYKQLEKDKFHYKVYTKLNDKSSLYEILRLANSYYCYMVDCIIRNDEKITQEEIDKKIEKLDEFLKMPYNALIKNTTILEEKDIAMIIKDRNKLLDFNIEKEDISANNIDGLIRMLENIKTGINLKKAGLEIKTIEELCTIRKLLK